MPADFPTVIGIGVAVVVVLWLVFSVLKKLIGLVLIAAIVAVIAFAVIYPDLAGQIWTQARVIFGLR